MNISLLPENLIKECIFTNDLCYMSDYLSKIRCTVLIKGKLVLSELLITNY